MIQDRICELLKERGIVFEHIIHVEDTDTWAIFFYNNPNDIDDYKMIDKYTRICDLEWLEQPVISKSIGFERWLEDLDKLFYASFGIGHSDFEEYDWFAEYEGEHTPDESFEEWKLLTAGNSLGI